MIIIPIADVPAQIVSASLAGQSCQLRIVTRRQSLFMDVSVAGTPVVTGAICRDRVLIVRRAYLGLVGDLMFMDMQGTSDPISPGLGTRFALMYVEAADLAGITV